MPLTVLDVIVIVVVLISAILAMVRGFVREVLSIVSWVAAAPAAYFFYKPVVPLVRGWFDSEPVAMIVSAAAVFFVALIVASYITMKISDYVIDSRVGAFDRAFGFLFGAARGVLLLVVAMQFFVALVPKQPTCGTDAKSQPVLAALDPRLTDMLPKDLEGLLSKKPATEDDNKDASPPGETGAPPTVTPEPAPADGGVTDAAPDPKYDTQGVEAIIKNNGGKTTPAN